jgi:hypothetical protein
MKTARLFLAVTACLAPAYATYTYDYANLLNPANTSQWTPNGYNYMVNNGYYALGGNS